MSYKVFINSEGISSPRFVCDWCGKIIENVSEGNTTFDQVDQGLAETTHVHKECEREHFHERKREWHGLDVDLVYLCRSYGLIDPKGDPTELFEKCVEAANSLP
jgi:hypothetical protein